MYIEHAAVNSYNQLGRSWERVCKKSAGCTHQDFPRSNYSCPSRAK